jgi:hypothetical protein
MKQACEIIAFPRATAVAAPCHAETTVDAALVALGNEFVAAKKVVVAARARYDALDDLVNDAVAQNPTWPAEQAQWKREDAEAYWQALKHARQEIGGRAHVVAEQELAAALDAADKIVQAILTTPALTIAGLCVKADATAFAANLFDEPIRDMDYDKQVCRQLVEAIHLLKRPDYSAARL